MKENSIEDRIEEKYTNYLNCETDELDLNIEESIFILEKDKKEHFVDDLLEEAYKVILSDYKRVLKENEEYLKQLDLDYVDNNYIPKSKIKEKIKELENIIRPKQEEYQKLCQEINKPRTETELDYIEEELSILDDELKELLIKKRTLQELLEEQ